MFGKFGNLSIEGVSRSTIETYFYIEELKFTFDIGKCPFHLTTVPNVFLSHMHGDHAMGMYYYISHRNLGKMPPGKIYLPERSMEDADRAIESLGKLEGVTKRNYELIPLEADQEFEYDKNHVIKTFATDHRIPSLGYMVQTKKTKLKTEFLNKSPKEIVELKKNGIEISNIFYDPLITYVGDSTIKPVDEYDFIKKSKILIIECTFLTPEHYDQAEQRKHIHLQNIIDRAEEFENEYILLTHFSMRYTENMIREYIAKNIPDCLKERVIAFF